MLPEPIIFQRIPRIANAKLELLLARNKPVALFDGRLCEIDTTNINLRRVSYIRDVKQKENTEDVYYWKIGTIITYHTFGASSLFMPSLAEVLAQINAQVKGEQLDRVAAFEIQREEMDSYNCLTDHYHFCKVHLYTRMER